MKSLLDPHISILIVDDNPQYSRVLKLMLERNLGYLNIEVADRVSAAYSVIEATPEKFQLLFVDFNFPDGENGGMLLERMASKGLMQGKVAFLITAEPTLDNFNQALAAGASGIVAKPFDSAELKKQIEKAERARLQDEGDSF